MSLQSGFGGMIGQSTQMRELFDLISCVAEEGDSTVVIGLNVELSGSLSTTYAKLSRLLKSSALEI